MSLHPPSPVKENVGAPLPPKHGRTTAFFTDSTLCIGCKACEVACKEWNGISSDGYHWTGYSLDNTGALGHSTWRHVKFIEDGPVAGLGGFAPDHDASYTFSSDVCKHCENAGCLEACPTGALTRTQYGGVYLQPDVCNGCSYCVVSCPFGVVQRNPDDGRAFKCTFCTDRQNAGLHPACAAACPTESIMFGEINDLHERAAQRLTKLHAEGINDAVVYDPQDTSVGGIHAFFLLRGDPRQYNLPPKPEVPTIYAGDSWRSAAMAAGLLALGTLFAFLGDNR
jgi:formate dehydrogenase iron-sulfur subunit